MVAAHADRRARGRHAGPGSGDGNPRGARVCKVLGVGGREWSPWTSVTASPMVEHLALAAGDALLASCNLCLLAFLRPTWFEEASDDVRSDVVELPKPSVLFVMLLAIVCGLGGAIVKVLVLIWCLSQSTRTADGPPALAHWRLFLQADSLGGYVVCLRVVLTLFFSWIFVTAALFHLLGAPLESIPSSLFLGVFFTTIGFLGPYASAVAEGCRSVRWGRPQGLEMSELQQREEADQPGSPKATMPVGTRATLAAPLWLRVSVAFVGGALRALDLLCCPFIFACRGLQARLRRQGSSSSSLYQQELGNLLVFLSIMPLVVCCLLCLIGCIFLPMDWPTVYVVYPSPLVVFISLGYPLVCFLCFFILLLLPVHYNFPNHYARALPVLQELMLKPAGAFPAKNAAAENTHAENMHAEDTHAEYKRAQ